ncbi:hypothetical protein CsSME_00009096 [Camellia sinensis var. sinensis]
MHFVYHCHMQVSPISDHFSSPRDEGAQRFIPKLPPAFGSSPNLESLALEANKSQVQDGDSVVSHVQSSRPMHEITFSTDDKPKLLSQVVCMFAYFSTIFKEQKSKLLLIISYSASTTRSLSSRILQLTALLGEVGLNIQEAHVFSTVDGYSLDVFVVDGWPYEVFSFHIFLSSYVVECLYSYGKQIKLLCVYYILEFCFFFFQLMCHQDL